MDFMRGDKVMLSIKNKRKPEKAVFEKKADRSS